MQVSVFRDKSAARCFGVLGIVGGVCTFLAGVTIVIIKASKGREKDEVLSYASIILIGVVIAALGVALSATAKSKRYVITFCLIRTCYLKLSLTALTTIAKRKRYGRSKYSVPLFRIY